MRGVVPLLTRELVARLDRVRQRGILCARAVDLLAGAPRPSILNLLYSS
jgi:hypothetical protein